MGRRLSDQAVPEAKPGAQAAICCWAALHGTAAIVRMRQPAACLSACSDQPLLFEDTVVPFQSQPASFGWLLQAKAAGGSNSTGRDSSSSSNPAAAQLLFSFFPDGASVPAANQSIGYRLLRWA